jgi:hypothetical protein
MGREAPLTLKFSDGVDARRLLGIVRNVHEQRERQLVERRVFACEG